MWPFSARSRKVRSSQAYWLLRNGIGDARPSGGWGAECDIAIIGAGITGAMVADSLVGTGARIVVLEGHEPAQGSTSASTALLQYEIDTDLVDLTRMIGASAATRAYRAGIDSFERMERRYGELLPRANYERRVSLYLASDEESVPALEAEHKARRAIGIACDWLDAAELGRYYGIRRPGAIRSSPGAQMDPLRLTRDLLAGCERHGVDIRSRARVESIDPAGDQLVLRTSRGPLTASHVVVCAGYESLGFLAREVANIDNTFALVTEPLPDPRVAATMPLIWESARPYFYMRGTADGRLLVGGEDVPFKSVAARELLLPRQVHRIQKAYEDVFGQELPPVAYTWAGSFATTRDGLPFVGPVPDMHPRLQFALCFGGNGITYSVQAGDIIRAHIEGRSHALDDLFGFARSSKRSGTDPPGSLQEGDDLRLDPSPLVQDSKRQTGTPINSVPS